MRDRNETTNTCLAYLCCFNMPFFVSSTVFAVLLCF